MNVFTNKIFEELFSDSAKRNCAIFSNIDDMSQNEINFVTNITGECFYFLIENCHFVNTLPEIDRNFLFFFRRTRSKSSMMVVVYFWSENNKRAFALLSKVTVLLKNRIVDENGA